MNKWEWDMGIEPKCYVITPLGNQKVTTSGMFSEKVKAEHYGWFFFLFVFVCLFFKSDNFQNVCEYFRMRNLAKESVKTINDQAIRGTLKCDHFPAMISAGIFLLVLTMEELCELERFFMEDSKDLLQTEALVELI